MGAFLPKKSTASEADGRQVSEARQQGLDLWQVPHLLSKQIMLGTVCLKLYSCTHRTHVCARKRHCKRRCRHAVGGARGPGDKEGAGSAQQAKEREPWALSTDQTLSWEP